MNCTIPAVYSTKFYDDSNQHFSRLTEKQGQKVFPYFFVGCGGQTTNICKQYFNQIYLLFSMFLN